MSRRHSTPADPSGKPARAARPAKPRPDFPLFPHAAGVWAKKIRGKLHYFGPWSDPDGALKSYLEQKDALHAGRKPRVPSEGATVKESVNAFLNAKLALVRGGELSPRTFQDYKDACAEVITAFGKGRLAADLQPDDFAQLRKQVAKKWGPHRLGKTIQCVRCLFKHAFESGLIDRPLRFGPGFKRPSKKVLRVHRAEAGPKLFSAAEVRRLIDAAGPAMKAMLLLGINCGFGNSDCGNLPLSAVDLENAVIDYPRPKTGVARRCPLWPETVASLREALACRPAPKREEDAALVFLTRFGEGWAREAGGADVTADGPVPADSPVSKETRKLLNRIGAGGRRNFYALRHTFRTVADGAKDQPAADFIMGHEVPHMSSVYRETISDERLRAVADHVRAWLFPSARFLSATAAE